MMSVTNKSNHSMMYKSKSGQHLNATKERINGENKQNRGDRRFEAFQKNRVIEPTPKKVIDTAADEGIGSFSRTSQDETGKVSENVPKKVSKQQEFKQRFNDYMKKKEEQKALKMKNAAKSKPFVSAVPSGKIVEYDKKPAVKRNVNPPAKRTKLAVVNQIPICDTPNHRSPINTRSKKLKLVPMMSVEQLTPKRKKRKSGDIRRIQIKSNAALSHPSASGRRLSVNKNIRAKTVNNSRTTSGAIKKAMRVTQPPKVVAKAKVDTKTATTSVKATTAVKKATTITPNTKEVLTKNGLQPKNAVKPSTSKAHPPQSSTTKQSENELNPPQQVAQFIKSPKIPARFKFGTSNWQLFNGGVASTAVKPKVTQNSSSSPKSLFNESFSPIEDDSEAKQESSSIKRRRKIHKTPKSVSVNNEQFVSPFVKITRKLPTISASDASNAFNVDNETTVTTASDEMERTPIQKTETLTNSVNYVSPFVTLTRGHRRFSAKKEAEARESMYKLDSRKSLDFNESVIDRQHREAAVYFRLQVQQETDRFNALCDKWTKYLEENQGTENLPEENVDQINVAIGQTRLLLRSKFQQFSTLVEQCADTSFTPKVKPQDLEGFWSLVRIQVDKLTDRYDRLDNLEQNQWQDPAIELVKVKKIRDAGIKKPKAQAKRPMNSALAQMLKAARKNYKETKNNEIKSDGGNGVMFLTKRKSILNTSNLNNSKTRRTLTPNKVPWTVSDTATVAAQTPGRGILKTPGSVRKPRLTLKFRNSPEIKEFNKENGNSSDLGLEVSC